MSAKNTISTEAALTLLANRGCRVVLSVLIDSPTNTVPIGEIAEAIAAAHSADADRAVGVDRSISDVLHTDLPRLEAAGIVDYDIETNTVHYHPHDRLETLHHAVTRGLEGDTPTDDRRARP